MRVHLFIVLGACLSISLLFASATAQSIDDEEETAELNGNDLGSGSMSPDDEDSEGSAEHGIPPMQDYATPQTIVHARTPDFRATTLAAVEKTTAVYESSTRGHGSGSTLYMQKAQTPRASTPRITTARPEQAGPFGGFSNAFVVTLLAALALLILLVIVIVCVCKRKSGKSAEYRPGVRE